MNRLSLQDRIDSAVEANLAPSDYFAIWEEVGEWQLSALKQAGMRPDHKLLDIGCGALRLGLSAIEYLDNGGYYGVDVFAPYIEAGRRLASRAGLQKQFHLLVSADFEFERFSAKFDFANAQSVFTHMTGATCARCLTALKRVMRPGGVFLFTYLIGAPATQGMLYAGLQPMRRFAEIDPSFFATLADREGLTFEPLAQPHFTGQQVGLYRFP